MGAGQDNDPDQGQNGFSRSRKQVRGPDRHDGEANQTDQEDTPAGAGSTNAPAQADQRDRRRQRQQGEVPVMAEPEQKTDFRCQHRSRRRRSRYQQAMGNAQRRQADAGGVQLAMIGRDMAVKGHDGSGGDVWMI